MWSFMGITALSWGDFLLLQLTLRHHLQGFASCWYQKNYQNFTASSFQVD